MSGASRFRQIKIYLGKCLRMFINESQWRNFISTLIIMILISLVISDDMFKIYLDTKNGCFATICACIWIGLFNSIRSVCRERPIVKHEHHIGLHISSYVLAHAVYELMVCIIETLIIVAVLLLKNSGHLPEKGLVFTAPPDMYITLLLVVFSADMLAIMLSCIVKSEGSAMTVMPFVLIVQLVMSGAVFKLEGITEKISLLTVSKWGQDSLISIANTNQNLLDEYTFLGLEGCDPTKENLLKFWGILGLYSILYILCGILFLKQVDKDKR